MAAVTDAVQMNVRLDRSLKREGDAALAEAGYTPSQAVRAVWELAVRLRNQPGRLQKVFERADALTPCDEAQDPPVTNPKLIAFRKGQDEVRTLIEKMRLSTEPYPNQPTDEEFREMWAQEMLYGDGVL